MILTVICIGAGIYVRPIRGLGLLSGVMFGVGVCTALVFVLFLMSFYHRRTQRGRDNASKLALAGISLVVSLILAELITATFAPALTLDKAVESSPSMFRQSTFLPFQLKPGYSKATFSRESRREVSLTINSHGFRGHDFTWEKPPGTYRILLLGDSFAINAAVGDDAVHTAELQKLLNDQFGERRRYQVINAGYADGYSPDSYLAFMLNQGLDLNPDLVIMQYFMRNDFKDLLETEIVETRDDLPFRVRSKYRHVDEAGRFRRNISFKYKLPVLRNSHLYVTLYETLDLETALLVLAPRFIKDYNGDNFTPNSLGIKYHHVYSKAAERPPALQEMFDLSLDYVRKLNRVCGESGVDFVLFLVPTGLQVVKENWPQRLAQDWDNPNPQKQIIEALQGSGVQIFNPLDAFRESLKDRPLYLGKDQDGHWTESGNRVAAHAMFDYLAGVPGVVELPQL